MSENAQNQSVRQLPPGKLGNLKKWFEENGGNSSQDEKQAPPPRPPLPPTRVRSPERPKPLAARKPSQGLGETSGNAPEMRIGGQGTAKVPIRPPAQAIVPEIAKEGNSMSAEKFRNSSAAHESVGSGEQRSNPAPKERHVSPTITRRINALKNSSSAPDGDSSIQKPPTPKKPVVQRKPSNIGVVENPVYNEDPVAAMYSKVNKGEKSGAVDQPKKVAFSADETNIQRREAVRKPKPPPHYRTTVASFEPEGESSNSDSGVSVASRTKLFDGQKDQKPIPPKKSDVVRSKSMRTSKEMEEKRQSGGENSSVKNNAIYDPPWDTGKNPGLEKLKQMQHVQKPISAATPPKNMIMTPPVAPAKPSTSPNNPSPPSVPKSKPPPLPSQPPPKSGAGPRRRAPSESNNQPAENTPNDKNISTPLPSNRESAAVLLPKSGPPPKPPRTHAHDSYILTKLSQDTEQADSGGRKKSTVQIVEPDSEKQEKENTSDEAEYFSVKDRIAQMMQPQQSKDNGTSSSSQAAAAKDQEVVMRQAPPSRPPPPKRRPNSGSSTGSGANTPGFVDHSSRCDKRCHGFHSTPSGPVIIPVYPRSQQANQHLQHPQHPAFQRQSSATYSTRWRNPTDDLPDRPDDGDSSMSDASLLSLKRFPLRKSYSSECLHSSRGSSLNISVGSAQGDYNDSPQGGNAMSRSSYAYEAVIDPDGYAVPNAFLKLPYQEEAGHAEEFVEASPEQFLTRLKGFGRSPGAERNSATPPRDGHTLAGKGTRQDLNKVTKKKMIMVREKINQAYAALDITLRSQVNDQSEDAGGSGGSITDQGVVMGADTEETVVEATELKRRIEYCTSVRLRSTQTVKRSKEYLSAIYPQLFEYCLVVGLRPLVDTVGYEPFLIHKFPENPGQFGAEVSTNLSIPSFCFPDASIFKPGSATSISESYSFVMTHADGSRVYGYCRRIQPHDSSLPEVICIISPIDAFNMYNTLLTEIETRRRESSDLAQEVIAASFGRPLPKPGKVCHIRTLDIEGEMETIFLSRPTDNRLDDVNYESPLFYLGTDRLVKVFSSMLMERRIILCSSNLSVLTQTVHALSALLYPFQWQHVYIPLLPAEMLDVVCAPMPYIVGVLSAFVPQVLKMDTEEVFIVDLDKKSIIKCQGDESTILPRKVHRALKTAINMCKVDSEAQNAQWLMVAEAFLRMFIETIGHFPNHVRTQQDGNRIFQKEGFILEMVSRELRQFLEWFTETQMFEVFIVNLVENTECWTSDVFMQRLKEHKESKEETNRRKGLGAKVKNFGKALKTKLQA